MRNVVLLLLFLCKKHVILRSKYLISIKPLYRINKKEKKIVDLKLIIVTKHSLKVVSLNVLNVEQEVYNISINFILLVSKKNYALKDLKMITKKDKLVLMQCRINMIVNYKKQKELVKNFVVIILNKINVN